MQSPGTMYGSGVCVVFDCVFWIFLNLQCLAIEQAANQPNYFISGHQNG